MKTVALIVAAGRGLRFGGDVPKQFRNVKSRPLLSWTIRQFEKSELIDDIVVVTGKEFLLFTNEKIINSYGFRKPKKVIIGGVARQESVRKGLKSLPISTGFVVIHDGVRPLVHQNDIDRVVEAAQADRAAILARPVNDTLKRVESDFIISTVSREKLYQAETPQAFQYDLIMSAHDKFSNNNDFTDDSAMIEALGFKVKVVIAEKPNIKVTTEDDLMIVDSLLEDFDETII